MSRSVIYGVETCDYDEHVVHGLFSNEFVANRAKDLVIKAKQDDDMRVFGYLCDVKTHVVKHIVDEFEDIVVSGKVPYWVWFVDGKKPTTEPYEMGLEFPKNHREYVNGSKRLIEYIKDGTTPNASTAIVWAESPGDAIEVASKIKPRFPEQYHGSHDDL